LSAQNIDHRKSNLSILVEDANGNALTDAVVDLKMTKHAFQFGTQVRDRFYAISQTEFDSLNDTQKMGLLASGNTTVIPTWQDALNYRNAVHENFNHVTPTNGMQWVAYENMGPARPDAAINQAQSNGLTVTGHAAVWGKDGWPTPDRFRSASSPDANEFHTALIDARLGNSGIMARYSDSGDGPTISDWDVLNEPINETYYGDTFSSAGIYTSRNHAYADFFLKADQLRPDAELAINEYNILSSTGDGNARNYRDMVNNLLALGAPIDRIKVQAHIGVSSITKADITRRLDILAETGLPIAISEFDMRDDSGQITPERQEEIFNDILTATFEHQSVDGFTMWGFWDSAHWRGNGPLFDADWNVKTEASAWYDLVRGDWMTTHDGISLDEFGNWSDDVIDGTYEFSVTLDGQTQTFTGYQVGNDSQFTLVVAVPEPSGLIVLGLCSMAVIGRRRRI
jgi:GH35 family endo-1,4-beta-xylanase